MTLLLAACAAGWGIALFVFAGFHATWTIGVTGGPNHGEHPFMVNLIHLIVAFMVLKGWPPALKWTYISLVGAATLLGIAVLGLRYYNEPKRCWAARAVMLGLYLALGWILFRGR